jgi:hypothetical protein
MKLYVQDQGVWGVLAAFADSEVEAREMMKDYYNYRHDYAVIEKPIEPGIAVANYGDC